MTTETANECSSRFNDRVRENPTNALLVAAGVGFAVGIIVRTLQPTAHKRGSGLIDSVHGLLHEVGNRTSGLVHDGTNLVQDGFKRFRDLGLEPKVTWKWKKWVG